MMAPKIAPALRLHCKLPSAWVVCAAPGSSRNWGGDGDDGDGRLHCAEAAAGVFLFRNGECF